MYIAMEDLKKKMLDALLNAAWDTNDDALARYVRAMSLLRDELEKKENGNDTNESEMRRA